MTTKKRGQKKGRRKKALGQEEPHRQCIVCRASKEPREMLRFARAPDGAVAFDIKAVLPGRGAWVCAEKKCLDASLVPKHGGFSRSFDAPVILDAQLGERVRALLLDDVLSRLGLLRRTGALVVGRDEVFRKKDDFSFVGLAKDLSANSQQEAKESLPAIELLTLPTMEQIADAIGTRAVGIVGIPKGQDGLRAALLRWFRTL